MERDEAKCKDCLRGDKTLNVHHHWYESNRDPWDYPDSGLITLCEDCHKITEQLKLKFLHWGITADEFNSLSEIVFAMRGGNCNRKDLTVLFDSLITFIQSYKDCDRSHCDISSKQIQSLRESLGDLVTSLVLASESVINRSKVSTKSIGDSPPKNLYESRKSMAQALREALGKIDPNTKKATASNE